MALSPDDRWLAAARVADRERAEAPMTAGADARIRAAIRARGQTRPRASRGIAAPAIAFGLGALLMLVLLRVSADRPNAGPLPASNARRLAGFASDPDRCSIRNDHERAVLEGPCRLRLDAPSLVIATDGAAEVERTADGVRVLRGWVTFDVEKVHSKAVRIEVSGGVIEVVGTRFVVFENGDAGHVDLLEGAIRFVDQTLRTHEIRAGQRFTWRGGEPAPAADAPSMEPTVPEEEPRGHVLAKSKRAIPPAHEPTPASAAEEPEAPSDDAADTPSVTRTGEALVRGLRQVARLRTAGRVREALELLAGLERDAGDAHTREVLSFERIRILGDELGEHDEACAAIEAHRRRLGETSYRDRIAEIEARLRCLHAPK